MGIASWATARESVLVVELKNGTSFDYVFYQYPMVFLDGDNLQIKAYKLDGDKVLGEKQCKYDYIVDEVRKFYFKPNTTTDINDIVKDNNDNNIKIEYINNQTIIISGTDATDRINIYTLDGRLVQNGISTTKGKTQLHLNSLNSGIYIIRVSEIVSFKICKP